MIKNTILCLIIKQKYLLGEKALCMFISIINDREGKVSTSQYSVKYSLPCRYVY